MTGQLYDVSVFSRLFNSALTGRARVRFQVLVLSLLVGSLAGLLVTGSAAAALVILAIAVGISVKVLLVEQVRLANAIASLPSRPGTTPPVLTSTKRTDSTSAPSEHEPTKPESPADTSPEDPEQERSVVSKLFQSSGAECRFDLLEQSLDRFPLHREVFAIWSDERLERSSYRHKLGEYTRRTRMSRGLPSGYRLMNYNSKQAGYAVAQRCGVQTPTIHQASMRIADLANMELPQRFVIKPHGGSTNRGIFLLEREDDDRYTELLTGRAITIAEVIEEYEAHARAERITNAALMEELLLPKRALHDEIRIPDDFKYYCFGERIMVVMQRRMWGSATVSDWRFEYWTEDWQRLGPLKGRPRHDPGLQVPEGYEEMNAAVVSIAREIDAPMVRIDMYDTSTGPVFGEITPLPGSENWESRADELLGRAWELAELDLDVRGVPWSAHR